MTEARDIQLERLFTESGAELSDDGFTATVMARTRRLKLRLAAGVLTMAVLLVVTATLLGAPLGSWAVGATRFFTTAIIDLGEAWWTLALAPVNTIGGLLVVGWRAARFVLRRLR